jgi:alpha-ketoglutarate-dependent taurine dioxygenase
MIVAWIELENKLFEFSGNLVHDIFAEKFIVRLYYQKDDIVMMDNTY